MSFFFWFGEGLEGVQKSLSFFNKIYRDLFIYWVKKNEHLFMKQGSLFVFILYL
jgi:hypothetical protein